MVRFQYIYQMEHMKEEMLEQVTQSSITAVGRWPGNGLQKLMDL